MSSLPESPSSAPLNSSGPSEQQLRDRYTQTPAASPMEFIQARLRNPATPFSPPAPETPLSNTQTSQTKIPNPAFPVTQSVPSPEAATASPTQVSVPDAPRPSLDQIVEQSFLRELSERQQEEAPPDEQAEYDLDEDEDEDDVDENDESENLEDPQDQETAEVETGPRASLRNLRKRLNEAKGQLQTVQAELQQTQTRLTRVNTGEEEPEVVTRLNSRIKDLEHYERLHAFRLSPEYKRQFTDPLETLRHKARKLAEEYAVPTEVLDHALRMDNKRDMNTFLHEHFGDEVAAYEAREVVSEIRNTLNQQRKAEQTPKEELQKLRDEHMALERGREVQRINSIINISKEGWQQASSELHADQTYPELTIKPDDPKHNQVTRPILEAAAREFGQFMRLLGALGVKELPPEVVKIIAKRFQLSQAAGVIAESRTQYASRANQVLSEQARRASLLRPQVGSQQAASPPAQNGTRGVEAFSGLLDNILRQRDK